MKPGKNMIAVIGVIITAFLLIAIFGIGSDIKGVGQMRYGIDICGGVEAVFEPQDLDRAPTEKELSVARNVIEMRLDAQNITDREVTVDNDGGYIIVRFPWKSDEANFKPEEAITELGEMAQLTFRDSDGNVLIEGKNVKSSSVQKDTGGVSTEYVVELVFDDEGAVKFEDATSRLIGQQMGIYMDDRLISNPVVETAIAGGQAVINGMSSYEEAKTLSDQINSGALPFKLTTSSFKTISPTLGTGALRAMVISGIIAFVLIAIYMIILYRLPGTVAVITLAGQIAGTLAAITGWFGFMDSSTLTIPGIAGIILAVGMGVDANIITGERIKEELNRGKNLNAALRSGYQRALSAIIDGNITTIIVAIILMGAFGVPTSVFARLLRPLFFAFGASTEGVIYSFGYTLMVGVLLNFVMGVLASRLMVMSLSNFKIFQNKKLYGGEQA